MENQVENKMQSGDIVVLFPASGVVFEDHLKPL